MYKTTARKHKNGRYDLYADLKRITSAFSDATSHAKGKAGSIVNQYLQDAKEKSRETKENITDYVAEKPFKTIGLAMLTGALIGYFLHK